MFTDKTDFNNILDKAATVWGFFCKIHTEDKQKWS